MSATTLNYSTLDYSTMTLNGVEFFNGTTVSPEGSYNITCEGYGSAVPNGTKRDFSLPLPSQVFYGTLCGLIALIGAVGNGTVIWICLYYRRMRTITNYFIANLAGADFLLCLLNVPLTSYFILTQNWPFGHELCTFINFIASTTVVASVFTMMCISIDRYIAIVHPMRPRMSSTASYIIIFLIWSLAGLISLPPLLYSTTHHDELTGCTICSLSWGGEGEDTAAAAAAATANSNYQIFYMVITYFVPLFALTFAYGRVANELWGSKSIGESVSEAQLESVRSKKKLVKVLIWVMVTFMVCWAPYHCWFIITGIDPCVQQFDNISYVFTSAYVLAMSNSIYNPIIYIILNNKFRQGFRQVFRWLPCIHWKSSEAIDHPHTAAGIRDRSSCTEFSTVKNGSIGALNSSLTLQHTRNNGRTVAAYKNNVEKVHLVSRKGGVTSATAATAATALGGDREDTSFASGSAALADSLHSF
ncbi:Tachykinin-like peptides receptor 99D [Hypsibius exemplaris]|uniref:Tachykinin-like peptides receptor 99D n=1 Tax=Hypsibius exemplaris TaxID=2072580 RepID=A0A9X6RLW1_HYPEX|nr:Tachykinin-like peptides receptor 99D [Hypsibius exemplaris]